MVSSAGFARERSPGAKAPAAPSLAASLAIALCLAAAALLQLWQSMAPDDGWLIVLAGRMLDGSETVYRADRGEPADVGVHLYAGRPPAARHRCRRRSGPFRLYRLARISFRRLRETHPRRSGSCRGLALGSGGFLRAPRPAAAALSGSASTSPLSRCCRSWRRLRHRPRACDPRSAPSLSRGCAAE